MATGAKKVLASVSLLLVPYFAPAAFAHHLMGGEVPRTAWQGLLSGLGHPIIGIDHFAFIVGVGCMAHMVGQLTGLPLLFIIGSVLGCWVHVLGYTIPWSELAIALTLALAAAVVGMRARAPIGALATAITIAGAVHGYAYGESIVGAERTPLLAYIVGFALIQYGIAVGSGLVLKGLAERHRFGERMAMRAASGGFALVACVLVANLILAR
ncbi:MAG TPA: HupE/UreJ family protein [Hyphomicrobiaceae bacterium]|jgi:urease accessory protein